jgi:hypothetical protein
MKLAIKPKAPRFTEVSIWLTPGGTLITNRTNGTREVESGTGCAHATPDRAYQWDVLLRVATHPHHLIAQLTPRGWRDTFLTSAKS